MRLFEKGAVLVILGLVLFATVASAEVSVSSPEKIYSFGDKFDLTVSIKPTQATSDFFVATMVCGGRAVEFYRAPMSLGVDEERTIEISTYLDSFIVEGVTGDCVIRAEYGKEKTSSSKFEIDGNVDVSFDLDATSFDPDSVALVSGTATKSNEGLLNGIVEVYVDDLDFSYSGDVVGGSFEAEIPIPSDALAGRHDVRVVAFEEDDSGSVTNIGEKTGFLKVNQIMKDVDVAIVGATVTPENDLEYSVVVYDQAGTQISDEGTIIIYRPNGDELDQILVKTSQTNKVYIESNYEPGVWEVRAKVGEMEASREFVVEEFEKIDFSLEEGILIVANVGNVPFTGPVEISIGGVNEIKDLKNLGVGEVKKFKLVAPDGEYNIAVNDGGEQNDLGSVLLTGKAISVKDVGGSLAKNVWVVVAILLVLGAGIVLIYLYRKFGWSVFKSNNGRDSIGSKIMRPVVKKDIAPVVGENVIDKGEKQQSAIVSLHIKNLERLKNSNGDGLKAIDSALWKAKESGAKIYSDGEYRVIVLAPILTKERDTNLKGLRVAEDIVRNLNLFNRRATEPIEFGVGVNYGNLIVESTGGKFKFISLDNVIAITKRVSQESKGEVLISEKLRRAVAGKVKTTKVGDRYWRLEKVTDRSAHEDFVSKFKERQKNSTTARKK